MLRIAMLSYWHVHARDYANQVIAHPDTEIVGVWDESAERGQAEAERLGVAFEPSLEVLLSRPDVDAVIVDAPTTLHSAVILAAARAGKHVFTEKVIAPTLHEANAIVEAIDLAGVKLTVSLPFLERWYVQEMRKVLASGLLGDLTYVRTRMSHSGALPTADRPNGWLPAHFFDPDQTAGGALIDLGCHPMYLARTFLGMPQAVSATFGYVTGRAVEDNASVTLRYPNGAIAVVEAGFVNHTDPFSIELHGKEGTLFFGTPGETLRVQSTGLLASGEQDWTTLAEMPPEGPHPFVQWITHIQQNTVATANIALALDLTALMEAATLSACQQQTITLASLAE